MKHSTTTTSRAKVNNLAESQQIVREVYQMYFMELRSGRTIEKSAYYFREETIKKHPPKPEDSFSLSTYNDQFVTFAFADGSYEIYVEDLGKKQEKGDLGERLMVSLSPSKDKDFLLHANNQEHSVELQKCENPLPDQTFFFLHKESGSCSCVSFECKSNPGVFIGVKDNHLALIQVKDQTEHSRRENIIFKLS